MKKLILFGGLFLGFVLIANPVMAKTGEPVKDVDVILDRLPGSVARTTKPISVDEVGIHGIVQSDGSGKPEALITEYWKKETVRSLQKKTDLINKVAQEAGITKAGDVPVDFIGIAYGEPTVFQQGDGAGDRVIGQESRQAALQAEDTPLESGGWMKITKKSQVKKGGRVALVGFGSFSLTKRAARTGRHPQTGKTIKIPAKKVVKFKAGSELSRK